MTGGFATLGEAIVDLVETGDDEPRLAHPGGGPYNVAIALARLGRPTAFVGRLSSDPLGTVLRRHAERSAVDLSFAVSTREPATVALLELAADGGASYVFGVDGTADFRFTDAELARVPDTLDALHYGSLVSWTAPGDAAVHRRVVELREQVLISYDPNVRPQLQPDATAARRAVERSVATAHLVKTSDDDLAYLYPGADLDTIVAAWLERGPQLVVVTHGADGSTAHTTRRTVSRPVQSISVVDTIGAGDAFVAGMLDALADDLHAPLHELDDGRLGAVLEHASLVAAITCSRAGANPPRRAELRRT